MNPALTLFAALLLTPVAALHAADASAKKPNIIFILADDLGWGDLGCYGNLDIATPNLDRMATEGMLFEQFYVNASLCSPSRAAMLTGRFPAELGIHYWMAPTHNRRMGMPEALEPKIENLPRTLQRTGYRTGHFGKWHVGEDKAVPVTAYGYDETDIIWQGVGPNPRVRMNAPDGTAKLVDRSIAFGEKCMADGRPFFVTLWLRDVHADLAPTAEALARYERFRSRPGIATAMQIYYAAVTEMDAQIGRLLDWIDAEPARAANTLVIFTSDNGPETTSVVRMRADYGHDGAKPWRGVKRDQWEGGHRVPFLVRWPNNIAPNSSSSQTISLTDIMATCAALTGATLPNNAAEDSFNILPVFLGKAGGKPIRDFTLHQTNSLALAIRQGPWKYLDHRGSGGNRYEKGELAAFALPDNAPTALGQLYNLETDPGETKNLYFEQPLKVKELKAKLDELVKAGRSAPVMR